MAFIGLATRRLRQKTTVLGQEPVGPLDLEEEVGPQAHRQVYLVTFPHPNQAFSAEGIPLVATQTLTKQQVLDRVLQSLHDPVRTDGRFRGGGGRPIPVLQTGV